MNARIESRAQHRSWILAALLGAAAAAAAGPVWRWISGDEFRAPEWLVQTARADVGKGDFLFLPSRMSMWVVNRTNGRIIQYQFLDNLVGQVNRTRTAAIDLNTFPVKQTEFLLSDRNLTTYLWVVNRSTGDFQCWRASRDNVLLTDELPTHAGVDLEEPPVEPLRMGRDRRLDVYPRRRAIGSGPEQLPLPSQPPAPQPVPGPPRSPEPPRARND